jgi:histone H3/H4
MVDDDQSAASSNPVIAEEDDEEASDNEDAVPVASVVAGPSYENESDGDDEKEDLDVTVDDDSIGTGDNSSMTPANRKRSLSESSPTPPGMSDSGKKRKRYNDGQPRKPAVRDLTLPYRSIKRTMKLDPSVGIVQNDAAYLVTHATELFIKKLAKDSQELALKKGRSIIKYDDLAEARAKTKAFSFLDMLIP